MKEGGESSSASCIHFARSRRKRGEGDTFIRSVKKKGEGKNIFKIVRITKRHKRGEKGWELIRKANEGGK